MCKHQKLFIVSAPIAVLSFVSMFLFAFKVIPDGGLPVMAIVAIVFSTLAVSSITAVIAMSSCRPIGMSDAEHAERQDAMATSMVVGATVAMVVSSTAL